MWCDVVCVWCDVVCMWCVCVIKLYSCVWWLFWWCHIPHLLHANPHVDIHNTHVYLSHTCIHRVITYIQYAHTVRIHPSSHTHTHTHTHTGVVSTTHTQPLPPPHHCQHTMWGCTHAYHVQCCQLCVIGPAVYANVSCTSSCCSCCSGM